MNTTLIVFVVCAIACFIPLCCVGLDAISDTQETTKYVVITAYTAKWCSACQKNKARLYALESDKVLINEIDADEEPELVKARNIKALPTYFAYAGDKELRTHSISELEKFVKDNLK
jgi:thiol:disulfide interchange protein